MCNKTYFGSRKDSKGGARPVNYIDPCIRNLIKLLNRYGIQTIASCCGHNIYPMTIVCKSQSRYWELLTNLTLTNTTRFYKRDEHGYYYIPQVLEHLKTRA